MSFSAILYCCSLPATIPERAKASTASFTTLSNGLTVATEDAATSSTVTMTYPKAGSGAEMLGEQGAALINKCLAFNSGSGLSTIMINRSIENEGAAPFASADRRSATLGYTVEPDNAVGLVPLLATDCTFEKWDVRDAIHLAAFQTAEANKSAQIVLTEQIYAAAYGPQSSMGRPLYCADAHTHDIVEFRGRGYGLNGAILTATGIADHAAFCTEVEEMLKEAPAGNSDPAPAAKYLGGEGRVSAPSSGYAHVALAFGATTSIPMRNVLKHCFTIIGQESGVTAFETPGLIGVYAGAPSGGVGALESALTNTMTTTPSADIIKRAKILAKAEALFGMDCGSKGLAAAITAYVMESGSFTSASDIAAAYDSISDKDVSSALSTLLKSNPSLAALGDISVVPYQGTFASRFS
jgi:predicted Zn-dependent peptidase